MPIKNVFRGLMVSLLSRRCEALKILNGRESSATLPLSFRRGGNHLIKVHRDNSLFEIQQKIEILKTLARQRAEISELF